MRHYSPEIENKIENIRDEFNALIADLQLRAESFLAKPVKPETAEQEKTRKKLLKRLDGVRNNLTKFNKIIEKLPPALTIEIIQNQKIDSKFVEIKRKQFDQLAKKGFYKYVADKHRKALNRMGLEDSEIEHMAQTGLVPHRQGKQLDLTIDHVKEISSGGKNKGRNLRVVPEYINAIRNDFTRLQTGMPELDLEQILSIGYTGRRARNLDLVPFIEGGFDYRSKIKEKIKAFYDFK